MKIKPEDSLLRVIRLFKYIYTLLNVQVMKFLWLIPCGFMRFTQWLFSVWDP